MLKVNTPSFLFRVHTEHIMREVFENWQKPGNNISLDYLETTVVCYEEALYRKHKAWAQSEHGQNQNHYNG